MLEDYQSKTLEEWLQYLDVSNDPTPDIDSTACSNMSRDKMAKFMRFAMTGAREGSLKMVDDIFQSIDVTKLDRMLISGMLRSTCMFKNHLNNWYLFRDRCVEYFENTNSEYKHLLRGLLDNKPFKSEFPEFSELIGIHPSFRD